MIFWLLRSPPATRGEGGREKWKPGRRGKRKRGQTFMIHRRFFAGAGRRYPKGKKEEDHKGRGDFCHHLLPYFAGSAQREREEGGEKERGKGTLLPALLSVSVCPRASRQRITAIKGKRGGRGKGDFYNPKGGGGETRAEEKKELSYLVYRIVSASFPCLFVARKKGKGGGRKSREGSIQERLTLFLNSLSDVASLRWRERKRGKKLLRKKGVSFTSCLRSRRKRRRRKRGWGKKGEEGFWVVTASLRGAFWSSGK